MANLRLVDYSRFLGDRKIIKGARVYSVITSFADIKFFPASAFPDNDPSLGEPVVVSGGKKFQPLCLADAVFLREHQEQIPEKMREVGMIGFAGTVVKHYTHELNLETAYLSWQEERVWCPGFTNTGIDVPYACAEVRDGK